MALGQNAGGADFFNTSTTPLFASGTRMDGAGGRQYIYGQASAALIGGQVCLLPETHTAALITTANADRGDRVAIAPTAFAANEWGWFHVYGAAFIQVAASCAANARLNSTATAGQIDDDGTTGAKVIDGVVLTVARGGTAGLQAAWLNNPTVGVTL